MDAATFDDFGEELLELVRVVLAHAEQGARHGTRRDHDDVRPVGRERDALARQHGDEGCPSVPPPTQTGPSGPLPGAGIDGANVI